MNHFSQEFQQTVWWTPQPPLMEPNQSPLNSQFPRRPTTTPFYNFNLNQRQDDDDDHHQPQLLHQQQFPPPATNNKEPLFEKPLTPSDVGKLNRLVIPKQHAERYFPLGGGNNGGEKGLLLNFEDEDGKSWKFRYSYWNSSQSYVLTKGWSRFVKDKRLDAGDVVLFERSRLDFDRLFIGWRRRNPDGGGVPAAQASSPVTANNSNGVGGWTRVFYSAPSYPSHPPPPCNGPVCMSYPQPQPQLQPPPPSSAPPGCCLHAAAAGRGQTSTPSSGNNKTLRLFGVNLECYQPDDESEPSTPDGSTISSLGGGQSQYHHYITSQNQNHHMEMDYSGYSGDMRRSHHQS